MYLGWRVPFLTMYEGIAYFNKYDRGGYFILRNNISIDAVSLNIKTFTYFYNKQINGKFFI